MRPNGEGALSLAVTNGNYDTVYLGGAYKEHREAYVLFDCLELAAGDKTIWKLGALYQKADEFGEAEILSQKEFDPITNSYSYAIPQGRAPDAKLFPKGLYTRHFRDCKGQNVVSRIVLEWEDMVGERKLVIHTYNYADDNHLKDDIRVMLPSGGEKRLQIPDGWGKAPADLNLSVEFQSHGGTNRLVLEVDMLSLVENLRTSVRLPEGWTAGHVEEAGNSMAVPSQVRAGNVLFTLPGFEKAVSVLIKRGESDSPPKPAIQFPRAGDLLQGVATIVACSSADAKEIAFMVDGKQVHIDREPPFRWEWNACLAESGEHTIAVRATDKAGK
jgi:hypothetical protein